MATTAVLEVDLRRGSGHDLLEKLERTTGIRFNVRRARVTARRSRWVLESDDSGRRPPK